MRWPLNHISPVSGCSNPTMCLSKTLFPVPLAPMMTMHLPGSMLSDTSLSTTSQPKRLETWRRSIKAMRGFRVRGSGFRKATLLGRELALKRSFESIQHAHTLMISIAKREVAFLGMIALKHPHVEMVNRFKRFAARAIRGAMQLSDEFIPLVARPV